MSGASTRPAPEQFSLDPWVLRLFPRRLRLGRRFLSGPTPEYVQSFLGHIGSRLDNNGLCIPVTIVNAGAIRHRASNKTVTSSEDSQRRFATELKVRIRSNIERATASDSFKRVRDLPGDVLDDLTEECLALVTYTMMQEYLEHEDWSDVFDKQGVEQWLGN